MKILQNLSIVILLSILSACGDSESPAVEGSTGTVQETPVGTAETGAHTVQGMKQAMDDAKAVEDLLQQRHDAQRKEIDRL